MQTPDTHSTAGARPDSPESDKLREAIDAIAEQIGATANGRGTGSISSPIDDRSLNALASRVNDLVHANREAADASDSRRHQLEAQNQELQQFAYVASHDLQEPLRMVSSFLTLLERRHSDQLDDSAREYIRYAVEGSLRMKELIQDLLEYSRVGSNERTMEPIKIDDAINLAIKDLGVAVLESDAEIRCGELPTVRGDEKQLVQLFSNLLSNAIKYRSERHPVIKIGAQREGDFWHITVADTGIGMEQQHLGRIFQIFQRLHPREDYEGTGIGLAIAKKIVEQHGGRIWVDSSPGEGSTFHFTLPDASHHPTEDVRAGR